MSLKTEEQRQTEWKARVNIKAPLTELAACFDLEYECLMALVIKPDEVVATVAKRNERGKFYVDEATGDAAKEVLSFKVRT